MQVLALLPAGGPECESARRGSWDVMVSGASTGFSSVDSDLIGADKNATDLADVIGSGENADGCTVSEWIIKRRFKLD